MSIAEWLDGERRRRGWSKRQLARTIDVHETLVGRWVAANPRDRVVPGPESCQRIATALDVDPDFVLSLAGHRPVGDPQAAPQDELAAYMDRLEQRLRPYPRPFWFSVVQAWERMADTAEDVAGTTTPTIPESPEVRAERLPPAKRPVRAPAKAQDQGASGRPEAAEDQLEACELVLTR